MASSGELEQEASLVESTQRQSEGAPAVVQEAVLVKSGPMPSEFSTQVKGYEFERGAAVDYHALLQSFRTSGFQATNFGLAVEQINKMVGINWNQHVVVMQTYRPAFWATYKGGTLHKRLYFHPRPRSRS